MDGIKYPPLYCCLLLAKMIFNNLYNPPCLDTWRNQPVLSSQKQVASYRRIGFSETIINSKYNSINYSKKIRGSLLSIYIPKMNRIKKSFLVLSSKNKSPSKSHNKSQHNLDGPAFIHKRLESSELSPKTAHCSQAQNTSTDFKVHYPALLAQSGNSMVLLLIRQQYPAIAYHDNVAKEHCNTTMNIAPLKNESQGNSQQELESFNEESESIFKKLNETFDAKDIEEGIEKLKSHTETHNTIMNSQAKNELAIQWIQDYLLSKNIQPIRLFREKSILLEEDPEDHTLFDTNRTELNYNE